jgi:hypothetical protein
MRMMVLLAAVVCCGAVLATAAGQEAQQEKAKDAAEPRLISGVVTADEVRKQVDFDKEYLMLFRWSGSGQDRLTAELTGQKEGRPMVVFHFTGGKTKDLKQHSRLFAIGKGVPHRLDKGKSGRQLEPTEIKTAKEVSEYFPAEKLKFRRPLDRNKERSND